MNWWTCRWFKLDATAKATAKDKAKAKATFCLDALTSLSIPRLLLSGAILSATLSATLSSAARAEPHPRQAVKVLAINNGQEVLVDLGDQGRAVRLACVQAPLAQQQPWSRLAIQQLQRLLPVGSEVVLEWRARDVYGRLVARLLMQDNDVAQPLLLQGVVFAYDGYLGRCDDLPYVALEAQAQNASLGIWGVQGGLERPWDLIEAEGGMLTP